MSPTRHVFCHWGNPPCCTMSRESSSRAEPPGRGAADEGVDAADDDDDDGQRCEHAHDEDDVRRLPSSADACQPDQLSGLAGVQIRSHAGSRRDGVDDDDDDDDEGGVLPPASYMFCYRNRPRPQVRAGGVPGARRLPLNLTELVSHHERDRYGNKTRGDPWSCL